MVLTWLIIWIILVLLGVVGSIVPMLPWIQFAYLWLLIFHFMAWRIFSLRFLIFWFFVVVIVMVLDNFLPVFATKKFWGSKYWMWGAVIGTFIWMFFWLWGIIIGPFLGAWFGEYLYEFKRKKSLRPAIWSFIGVAMSWIIKIWICLIMWRYIVSRYIGLIN